MLITKRTLKRKYVIGGTRIFDSFGNFLRECFRVMRQKTISVGSSSGRKKTAAKDMGVKAIDVGKTVAIDAGKRLLKDYQHQNHKWLMLWLYQKRFLKK